MITTTITEEIIVDTTNNNLKWDQHKITWKKKSNKHNDDVVQNCPEKYDTLYTQDVLYQSNFDHPKQLKALVSESWKKEVLDSGPPTQFLPIYSITVTNQSQWKRETKEKPYTRKYIQIRGWKIVSSASKSWCTNLTKKPF